MKLRSVKFHLTVGCLMAALGMMLSSIHRDRTFFSTTFMKKKSGILTERRVDQLRDARLLASSLNTRFEAPSIMNFPLNRSNQELLNGNWRAVKYVEADGKSYDINTEVILTMVKDATVIFASDENKQEYKISEFKKSRPLEMSIFTVLNAGIEYLELVKVIPPKKIKVAQPPKRSSKSTPKQEPIPEQNKMGEGTFSFIGFYRPGVRSDIAQQDRVEMQGELVLSGNNIMIEANVMNKGNLIMSLSVDTDLQGNSFKYDLNGREYLGRVIKSHPAGEYNITLANGPYKQTTIRYASEDRRLELQRRTEESRALAEERNRAKARVEEQNKLRQQEEKASRQQNPNPIREDYDNESEFQDEAYGLDLAKTRDEIEDEGYDF